MALPTRQNFPPMQPSNMLLAARGQPTTQIPVWIMRQAGRYLPEFREFRKTHDFFEICRTPEFATEVTMQPLRRFALDASIIFSDILVIPQALGMVVEMHPGKGPVFPEPLETPADLARLQRAGAVERLAYVGEAITLMRHRLNGFVPLIGFSGAPWTLLGYMIEGGGSKTLSKALAWLRNHPAETAELLELLADTIVEYFEMQVKAGAQVLQLFESSADALSKDVFAEVSLPHCRRIRQALNERLRAQNIEAVPMIFFAKGGGHSLREQADCGFEVIGVDYNTDAAQARAAVGPDVTLQGNLDPQDLYKPQAELRVLIERMLRAFGKQRYIANLGHGITPETPIESVETLIRAVHGFDGTEVSEKLDVQFAAFFRDMDRIEAKKPELEV